MIKRAQNLKNKKLVKSDADILKSYLKIFEIKRLSEIIKKLCLIKKNLKGAREKATNPSFDLITPQNTPMIADLTFFPLYIKSSQLLFKIINS